MNIDGATCSKWGTAVLDRVTRSNIPLILWLKPELFDYFIVYVTAAAARFTNNATTKCRWLLAAGVWVLSKISFNFFLLRLISLVEILIITSFYSLNYGALQLLWNVIIRKTPRCVITLVRFRISFCLVKQTESSEQISLPSRFLHIRNRWGRITTRGPNSPHQIFRSSSIPVT